MNFQQKFTIKFRRITKASLSFFLAFALLGAERSRFTFSVIGDRTGETIPGVYEEVWKAVNSERPDFVVNVGDSIQGGDDSALKAEWNALKTLLIPFRRYPLYFTPGNHDIWSPESAAMYQKYSGRPVHYSFDYRQAHFTILDNSRTPELSLSETTFLESDLKAHAKQAIKFIVFHRPSWLMPVLLQNPEYPLHRLAKQYGVQYVICGHVHQMLHFEFDGVTYLSMPSAGGHLRNPKTYERGWFFGQTLINVNGNRVSMEIRELGPPFGQSRVTSPDSWGAAGLRR